MTRKGANGNRAYLELHFALKVVQWGGALRIVAWCGFLRMGGSISSSHAACSSQDRRFVIEKRRYLWGENRSGRASEGNKECNVKDCGAMQTKWAAEYGNRHCQASKGFDKHVRDDDAGFVDTSKIYLDG